MSSHWSNVDIHPSLPTIVASSDLFDGELFGDELIDIYDSAVDAHNANDGMWWEKIFYFAFHGHFMSLIVTRLLYFFHK